MVIPLSLENLELLIDDLSETGHINIIKGPEGKCIKIQPFRANDVKALYHINRAKKEISQGKYPGLKVEDGFSHWNLYSYKICIIPDPNFYSTLIDCIEK
jgi:hypothetical protein